MPNAKLRAMVFAVAVFSTGAVSARTAPPTPAPEPKAGTKGASDASTAEGWKPNEKPAPPKPPAQVKKPEAQDVKKPEPASLPPAAASPGPKVTDRPAPTIAAAAQSSAVPAPEVLLMLVRTTLVALNQAGFTANYSVLHGLGSPGLQAKNTPEALGNAFATLRHQGVDLSPVMVLTPQLTQGPLITSEGALQFAGYFPSKPLQINFAMSFMPVEGRWRIDALSVAAVAAAQASAAPASAPLPATNAK